MARPNQVGVDDGWGIRERVVGPVLSEPGTAQVIPAQALHLGDRSLRQRVPRGVHQAEEPLQGRFGDLAGRRRGVEEERVQLVGVDAQPPGQRLARLLVGGTRQPNLPVGGPDLGQEREIGPLAVGGLGRVEGRLGLRRERR